MALALGDRLGPYEILSRIGAGGMGEVWKARDPRVDRIVAIKTIAAHFSDRFDREARAIAALNHPHICQLFDVGPDYLVMEFIEGGSLAGPLPLAKALEYAVQICDALDAAHCKGIAHRDLKPANILVTKVGIKLLDFGLAKSAGIAATVVADETVTKALTGQNEIVGTLQYMSPEQLQGTVREVDVRTDIFSFGLVLYEIVTGKLAFDGPSPASVSAAILERPAPSIAAVAPPALDRLLQRCLAKDPDERWQTARDLCAELEWIASAPATPTASSPTRRWPLLVGALALLALALGDMYWLRRTPPPLPAPRLKIALAAPADDVWNSFRLSPDGKRVVYRSSRGLYVRALDSLEAEQIGAFADRSGVGGAVAWSPDGRFLLYTSNQELHRVEVPGGTPQTLASSIPFARGAAWSPAGVILFSAEGLLQRIPANGGAPARAVERFAVFPSFLPDSRHYLFLGREADGEETIYVATLDSNEVRKVTPANSKAEYIPSGHLLFLRGTTLMAQPFDLGGLRTTGEALPVAADVQFTPVNRRALFSASDTGLILYQTGGAGHTAVTWVDRSGKALSVLDNNNRYADLAVSPDGKSVAGARLDPKTLLNSIWITDLARGVTSRLTPDEAEFPSWSPDGKQIAYWTESNKLFVRDATGAGARQLLANDAEMPNWALDGKAILFRSPAAKSLQTVAANGGQNPVKVLDGDFFQPGFSPDGRWIAYVSTEAGAPEVFVQSVPSGRGKWQVSIRGGTQPVWRQDGKELFYLSADSKITAVPVKTGAAFEAGAPKELFAASLQGGVDYIRRKYAVSSDGQRFLLNLRADGPRQMILLQNWLGSAK
jgi:serine/threonine protein kinase